MAGVPSCGMSRLAVPAGAASVNIDVTLYPTDDYGTPTAYNLAAAIASAGVYQPAIAVTGAQLTNGTITIDSGTWIAASRTLRKTGAYSGYGFLSGDRVYVDAGSAPGYYDIESKTDDNNIVLKKHIALANMSGVNGSIQNVACITASNAFTNYVLRPQDRITLTSGTGLNAAGQIVPVLARISASQIRVPSGLGTVASDLVASIGDQFLVSKTGAFASYNWRSGDTFTISSGTGLTAADYVIAEKISDDLIRLTTDAGAAATDLVGLVPTQTVRANASILRDSKETLITKLFSTTPAATDEFNVVDNAGNAVAGLSFKGAGPFDLGEGVTVQGNVGLKVHSVTAISGANTPAIVMLFKRTE